MKKSWKFFAPTVFFFSAVVLRPQPPPLPLSPFSPWSPCLTNRVVHMPTPVPPLLRAAAQCGNCLPFQLNQYCVLVCGSTQVTPCILLVSALLLTDYFSYLAFTFVFPFRNSTFVMFHCMKNVKSSAQ